MTSDSVNSFKGVDKRFKKIEKDLQLFERRISGVEFWERIRWYVQQEVLVKLGLIQKDGGVTPKSATESAAALVNLGKSLTTKNPLSSEPSDILIWGHPRRKKINDKWWDVHSDYFIESLSMSYTYLEEPHESHHYSPTKIEDVNYLDFFYYIGNLPRVLPPKLRPHCDLSYIENRIHREFGVDVPVSDMVSRDLAARKLLYPLYEKLLDRQDPDVFVVVCNYDLSKRTMIEVCKDRGTPVVELQHGVISRYHYGYAYPEFSDPKYFPDYFVGYGPAWFQNDYFPVSESSIYFGGNPYNYSRIKSRGEKCDGGEGVLFISQESISNNLAPFAAFISEVIDREVYYKLHPSEMNPPDVLSDSSVIILDGASSVYDAFSKSSIQIGVYSTALYEGLQFGLSTIIINLSGHEYMEDLVRQGHVSKVASKEELLKEVQSQDAHIEMDQGYFVKPNQMVLEDIIQDLR